MPFIRVSLSKNLSKNELASVREIIAEAMPLLPTKTRENTMIQVEGNCCLSIGDPSEDCLFVDLRVFRASPTDAKKVFVEALCKALSSELDIPVHKMYVNIQELQSWGSRGTYNEG